MLNDWGKMIFDRYSQRSASIKPPPEPVMPDDSVNVLKAEDLEPNKMQQNSAQYEGHKEADIESFKDQEQHEEKFNKLLTHSTTTLLSISTFFPFTIFPHKLIITLNDVNFVYTEFFISKQIRSISISKIAEVIVNTGFFFAQLQIIDKDFSQMTIEMEYLKIKDAMKAKRLIQGMLFASKEKIDLTKIDDANLVAKLEELGRVQGESLDKKSS